MQCQSASASVMYWLRCQSSSASVMYWLRYQSALPSVMHWLQCQSALASVMYWLPPLHAFRAALQAGSTAPPSHPPPLQCNVLDAALLL